MRKGEKCIFVLAEDMFGGKLKARHRYNGIYAGGDRVRYRTYNLVPEEIIPIKKTVKKEKAPTASDYKNFSDLCFEVAIRYRDNWQSVISGKKFEEGDWNGLQAGHGISRQHWATRHDALNCHAITSGENFHMSIGTTTIIAKYWAYVTAKYGQNSVQKLINDTHETPKLSISYLKEDCKDCFCFLFQALALYSAKNGIKLRAASDVIKWRCEKYPKKKAEGVLKVLNLITEGKI